MQNYVNCCSHPITHRSAHTTITEPYYHVDKHKYPGSKFDPGAHIRMTGIPKSPELPESVRFGEFGKGEEEE